MILLYKLINIWIRFMILATAIKNSVVTAPKAKPVVYR
jgi:hypothetical protein